MGLQSCDGDRGAEPAANLEQHGAPDIAASHCGSDAAGSDNSTYASTYHHAAHGTSANSSSCDCDSLKLLMRVPREIKRPSLNEKAFDLPYHVIESC